MPFKPRASRFWHYDFQIRGRRFHGSCGTTDFEEAKAVEAAARVRAKAAPVVTGRYTLAQALGTYFADIATGQPSEATTRSQFAGILEHIDGTRPIESLTTADVMRFVARRRAHVSNGTVNRQLQALGRALRHMARVHGAALPQIDLRALQTPEAEERVRELSAAEQDRLFAHLRPDLHPLVLFALMTGARQATAIGLRWSDIDHDTGRMLFRMKGGRSMRFPMNAELRALLSGLPRSDLLEHRPYVFTFLDQSNGQRRRIVKNSGVFGDFRAAVTAAEIGDFRFHDLRHTFATRLLRQTGNLKLVSRLLGHSTVETTARYAHVLDHDMAHALDCFSVTGNTRVPRKSQKQENSA